MKITDKRGFLEVVAIHGKEREIICKYMTICDR